MRRFAGLAAGVVALVFASVLSIGCGGDEFAGGPGSAAPAAGGTGGAGGPGDAATGTGGAGSATSSIATSGAGGGTCQSLGDPCSDCSFDNCNALYCTCYADQDCAALVACFNACPPADLACQQTCMTAHPDNISLSFVLGSCSAGACASECPGTQVLDTCSNCLFTSCDNAMNACISDPECSAILQCAQTCAASDSACVLACGMQHPSGQGPAFAVQACANQACTAECG